MKVRNLGSHFYGNVGFLRLQSNYKEIYLEKFEKLVKKEEQNIRDIEKHKKANAAYFHMGLNLIELTQTASDLYISAKLEDKRELLEFVFLNFSIRGKNINYEAKRPFSDILKYANRQQWSPLMDAIRNLDFWKMCSPIESHKFITEKINSISH